MSLALQSLLHHRPFCSVSLPPPCASIQNHQLNFRNPTFRCEAASISGSASEYPEELLGNQKKKKKESIAGIDQDELLDPIDLADPDSYFIPFNGLHFHYKICQHSHHHQNNENATTIGFPMILLHGFGASLYSWKRAMKPLANLTSSKVLSFDRPAFGLTSRVSHTPKTSTINPYSMPFSVKATLFFLDVLAADKAILIGHSAGSLVAVDAYFEAPERVAAMILIAPAIVAPLSSSKPAKANMVGKKNKIEEEISNSNVHENLFTKFGNLLSKFSTNIARTIAGMLKGMVNMVSSLYRRVLTAILRSAFAVMLVRMAINKFGIAAIKNSWYDASQIDDHVLDGYTKPLRTKGWDRALVEYTIAMLIDSAPDSKPPLSKRLSEISCPVLVITGDNDRLVPSWNAERLSRAIPGCSLEVIKNCGHLPHEEKVEEFVSAVQKFLLGVFGAPKEQFVPAAA